MKQILRKIMILVCFITLVTIPTSASATVNVNIPKVQITNNGHLESFNVEELNEHSDVKDYINENGFETIANEFVKENKMQKFNSLRQSENDAGSVNIDEKTLEAICQKYGLSEPDYNDIKSDVMVLVERNNKNQSSDRLSAEGIDNVWYITYWTNDASFKIDVINIGDDPLDVVSGSVKLMKLNSSIWNVANSTSFSKYNVGSSNVFTWYIYKDQVKEAFDYNISITEDGGTWYYSNSGQFDQFRYNFAVGPYASITANGGERHHFVSSNSLALTGWNTSTATAIRMVRIDHLASPNWGSSTAATLFRSQEVSYLRAGRYEDLIQLEVDGLEVAPDPEGVYNSLAGKYYDQISYALYYMEVYFGILK